MKPATRPRPRPRPTGEQAKRARELFDLEADPAETNNLWDEPSAASLKAQLLHELAQATLQCEPTRMPRIAGA